MSKRKTDKEFKKEVFNLVKDEYEFLDEYVNAITAIKCRHNKCGYVWKVRPTHFTSLGVRCPKCGKHKKTNKQFLKEVENLVGDEYEFLEEYDGAHKKIKVKHNICGHIYKVNPDSFLHSSSGCPKCAGNMRRTTEQYKKEVYEITNGDYIVLGEYTNSHNKVKMKHNNCGCVFEKNPVDFLSGSRCPDCTKKKISKRMMLSDEEFKNRVKNMRNNEYVFLEKYAGIHERIKIKHKKCGYEWYISPNAFYNQKNICPKCSDFKNFKKTNERFLKEVCELVGAQYTFLEDYINIDTKIKVRHNKCGHEYKVAPSNFLSGKRCPKCYGSMKLTEEEFEKRTKDLYKERYTILGIYKNMKTKIKIKCNKCGYVFKMKPNHFLNGHGCSCCNLSKGESLIEKWLKNNNINYKRQYSVDECRYKNRLSFDFAVFEQDKLILLVEYDGLHHFEPVDFAGKGKKWAAKRHRITKRKDKIKNDFCKANNIPLLRIPYWDKELALSIIKQSLNKNKQLTFYNIY